MRGFHDTLLTAGADTVSNPVNIKRNLAVNAFPSKTYHAMQALFLAMAMYPNAQKKAQEELDRVVGKDRLPDFQDQDSLPYINALIMELLRWHPVAPVGVPHRSLAADVYNGWYIPAGTTVVVNLWYARRVYLCIGYNFAYADGLRSGPWLGTPMYSLTRTSSYRNDSLIRKAASM